VFGHPTHVTVEPSGRFVYITTTGQQNPDAGVLLSYSINATSGALSPIDVQFIDPHPSWVESDPTGQFLYVGCAGPGPGTIRTYRLPLDTGIPISVDTDPAPAVSSLGFHPSGRYVYATLKGGVSFTIYFTINVLTGELTQAPGTVSPGVEPSGVTVSRDGKSAYVAYTNTLGHGHVAFFHIDPMTGELLLPAELSSDGTHPTALAIDQTGRFLYVSNNGSNNVSVMAIDPDSGQLTIGTPKACGLGPSSILVLGASQ
jgi:6-phosphogluconolactonase